MIQSVGHQVKRSYPGEKQLIAHFLNFKLKMVCSKIKSTAPTCQKLVFNILEPSHSLPRMSPSGRSTTMAATPTITAQERHIWILRLSCPLATGCVVARLKRDLYLMCTCSRAHQIRDAETELSKHFEWLNFPCFSDTSAFPCCCFGWVQTTQQMESDRRKTIKKNFRVTSTWSIACCSDISPRCSL